PRKDRRFYEVVRTGFEVLATLYLLWQQFAQRAARHETRGYLCQRDACGFRDIRYGARGARIDFDDVDLVRLSVLALDGKLQVHETYDVERKRKFACVGTKSVEHGWREIDGRQHAGGVAGVDAGFLNVLHDAGDDNIFAIAEGVNVNLDSVFEEVVNENRAF